MKQFEHSDLSFYAHAALSKWLNSILCAHFEALHGRKNSASALFKLFHARSKVGE